MLSKAQLKNILHKVGLTKSEKLLICLAVNASAPKPIAEVYELAVGAGLRSVKSWNAPRLLSGSRGRAIRTSSGWELTEDGREKVAKLVGPVATSPLKKLLPSLRAELTKIKNPDIAAFVQEAVQCLECGHLRAGVVLCWVGALGVLYSHVIDKHLTPFNDEAFKRNPKWKPAKSIDDLARMNEADFLIVLESASVIGKSLKHDLEGCLKLRNGAGHPNQFQIGQTRAASHVETLILNVFSKFS